MPAAARVGSKFVLNETQQTRLLTVRAAREEGEDEERLERLRQRAEDAETLRAFHNLLEETRLAAGHDLNYTQALHLLNLARALAPNPNLDVRLLRQPGEPGALNRDLRDLLFGAEAVPARLRAFLSRRRTGGQTATQLLCAAFPEAWPLLTKAGTQALQLTAEQEKSARNLARERWNLREEPQGKNYAGVPDSDPVLRLLADLLIYEAVHEAVESPDFVATHRLLTQGLADRPRRIRRFTLPAVLPYAASPDSPVFVREEAAGYAASEREMSERETPTANILPAPDAPDISNVFNRDVLPIVERYVAAQGFTYPALALRDYYIALQTRPFCVLSGITGTGKTRLTSLFAEALTESNAAQYRLLPVRPDWADSAPLLGYVNLLAPHSQGHGQFVTTPFLDFLRRAAPPENAWRTYFLCLDEMNLARVEHYFAEVLSAMETPTRELLLPDGRPIRLPANFFITGTLNLDEATYALSRKVLDRANTIAFDAVSLRDAEPQSADAAMLPEISPAMRQAVFLQARVVTAKAARERLRQAGEAQEDFAARVVNTLAEINDILQPHGLAFAYRLRDEVLRYCANSFDQDGIGLLVPESGAVNLQTALDLQVLQKVLPRFHGGRDVLEVPLRELLAWAESHEAPRTADKLDRLLHRLLRDGYAAFDAV